MSSPASSGPRRQARLDKVQRNFERRKLSLGTCGRSYATPCIHEHACIRCPLLRPDPAQRPRLTEIRDNLIARLGEAQREGWTGEADGLQVSLAAAGHKLAQMSQIAARRATVIHLGMPGHPPAVSRIVTTPASHPPTTHLTRENVDHL